VYRAHQRKAQTELYKLVMVASSCAKVASRSDVKTKGQNLEQARARTTGVRALRRSHRPTRDVYIGMRSAPGGPVGFGPFDGLTG
jgi:hypothetical protein